MAGVPSIGDILMLSNIAWKVGRAFSSGYRSAPAEFHQIEIEADALATVLTLLTESLSQEAEHSLLVQSTDQAREGISAILLSCQKTLRDLESLLRSYQLVKRTHASNRVSTERVWNETVLRNYNSVIWTADGGSIHALRNLLQMHSSTVTLLMHALESGSLCRLQATVSPIADKIDVIQRRLSSDLGDAIDDVLATLSASGSPEHTRHSQGSSLSSYSDPRKSLLSLYTRSSTGGLSLPSTGTGGGAGLPSTIETPELINDEFPSPELREGSWPPTTSSNGALSDTGLPIPPPLNVSAGQHPNRQTTLFGSPADGDAIEFVQPASQRGDAYAGASKQSDNYSLLSLGPTVSTVDSRHASLRFPEVLNQEREMDQQEIATALQQEEFERSVFKNSAILCDLRGAAVEYTQSVDDPTRPFDLELTEAAKECRICVVRKRIEQPNSKTRFVTTIWTFKEDRSVRLEHELPDGDIIPYLSYFQAEKVSVNEACHLQHHDVVFGCRPVLTAKTNWVNYIFTSPLDATLFQSVLFSHTLVATFKTAKTLRIHAGLTGTFAYQEQMCALEILRLWEAERSAAVLCTIHFSAQFRDGYLSFYLNSFESPVRVKDEGGKCVKIKGLKIPVEPRPRPGPAADHPALPQRRDSGAAETVGRERARRGSDGRRLITGARIEFISEIEKVSFLAKVKEVQRTSVDVSNSQG